MAIIATHLTLQILSSVLMEPSLLSESIKDSFAVVNMKIADDYACTAYNRIHFQVRAVKIAIKCTQARLPTEIFEDIWYLSMPAAMGKLHTGVGYARVFTGGKTHSSSMSVRVIHSFSIRGLKKNTGSVRSLKKREKRMNH